MKVISFKKKILKKGKEAEYRYLGNILNVNIGFERKGISHFC